jgi:ParB family chromosome partitioning protein
MKTAVKAKSRNKNGTPPAKAKISAKATKSTATKGISPTAAVDQGEFRILDIKNILPDGSNYRASYDPKKMEELTASVKSKGILQPVLVRPNGGKDKFKLVAGGRRHRAALNAGLTKMPAIIKDLSDAEALELQVIENSQREDPNPIEEANGFRRLIDLGKHTPETLALKLDKSVDYVLGRIKLLKLPEQAQKKILTGEISLGHALLLTRLRHPSEQKEFLDAIITEEMSVKTAKDSMEDFTASIQNAVFDTAECEKCPFLSRNQAILFPELKKSADCMDRGCYRAKTRACYSALLEEKKKLGFPIITDAKEAERLISYKSRTSCRIYPPDSASHGHKPKRYKSECMKCLEHHAFYLYEKENYHGTTVEFGEICLNSKCLDKMNNPAKEPRENDGADNGSSSSRVSPHTVAPYARACRDVFLRKELPARIAADRNIQKRLLIYSVLELYMDRFADNKLLKAFRSYCPKFIVGHSPDCIYRAVMDIEPERLDQVLDDILIASIDSTEPLVLLAATPEAGIDMTKDWGPDKAWLNSKTKEELLAFVNFAGLPITLTASQKKGAIVNAIAEQDLRGKLTKDLIETITVREMVAGEDPCDECERGDCDNCPHGEAIPCRVCGKTIDEMEDIRLWPEEDLCCGCAEKAEALKKEEVGA